MSKSVRQRRKSKHSLGQNAKYLSGRGLKKVNPQQKLGKSVEARKAGWLNKSESLNYARTGLALDANIAALTPESTVPSEAIVAPFEVPKTKPKRKAYAPASEHERTLLLKLVKKYGDDFVKMSRDMRLNVYQHTAHGLKTRILRYQAWIAENAPSSSEEQAMTE